jgi:23S rRNA (adenine-N6)-dimethyltransferase
VVVDVGAGSGRLTAELARAARQVMAVELDPVWAGRLRERWDNVQVIESDAAHVRLPRESFRVVANLPFDRTTDLLHWLLDDPRLPLARADLVVEWGVAAKRGLPWPSTLNDVVWGAFYEASVTRHLPSNAFEPQPSVDAGVLVFRRRTEPLIGGERVTAYRAFVARGFRRGLHTVAPPRVVRQIAGRSAVARDLDAHGWAELFCRTAARDGPTRRTPER